MTKEGFLVILGAYVFLALFAIIEIKVKMKKDDAKDEKKDNAK